MSDHPTRSSPFSPVRSTSSPLGDPPGDFHARMSSGRRSLNFSDAAFRSAAKALGYAAMSSRMAWLSRTM